jgi:hypothetical protein
MRTISAKKMLYLVLAAGMLYVCSMLMTPINEERRQQQLTHNEPLENAPPELELATKVLGGFRGIIADVLWLRAQKMMTDGRYFEMVQLHDWIAYLEPHIADIWAYSGWNMAYNISVEMKTPEERWYWVKKGIEHLRDKGIQWNKDCAQLYWELGWIYSHKIGASVDYQHRFYKKELALEMWDVLGDETPDIKAFAKAPKTREGLLRDELVREYVKEFSDENVDILGEDFFALSKNPDAFTEEAARLFNDEAYKEPKKKIETYLRAKRLREECKLDPETMVKIMYGDPDTTLELEKRLQGYGELDWRLPEAHALYWGKKSLEVATEEDFEPNFDRLVLTSLEQSFYRGKLIMNREARVVTTDGNYKFAGKLDTMYEYLFDKYRNLPQIQSFRDRHRNFLVDVMTLYYTYDMMPECLGYFRQAKRLYGGQDIDFQLTPEEFILKKILVRFRDQPSLQYLHTYVQGLITRSLTLLAAGDYPSADRYLKLARKVHHEHNMQEIIVTEEEGNPERKMLPPFEEMLDVAKGSAFLGQVPAFTAPVMQKRLQEALELTDAQVEKYRNDLKTIIEERVRRLQEAEEQE